MYMIPANTKKSTLIFGFMRTADLIIVLSGLSLTVILLLAFEGADNIFITIGMCLPMIICGLLILPIPNYHNTLVAIQSILRYYRERRRYIWKGWCIYDEYKND